MKMIGSAAAIRTAVIETWLRERDRYSAAFSAVAVLFNQGYRGAALRLPVR